MKKLLLAVIVLLLIGSFLVLWTSGMLDPLLSTSIAELHGAPASFPEETRVLVHGRVTQRVDVPFSSTDFYRVGDGSGEVWIRTDVGLPPEGARVLVRGVVHRVKGDLPLVKIRGLLLEQESIRVR
jgi:hypothetical protein